MRAFIIVLSLFVLAGCGAQQHRSYGIQEESQLVVRGEQLVGASIAIGPSFSKVLTKEDLTPYEMGVPGAKNREEEDLETVTIKVTPGSHKVRLERDGAVLLEQELYFSQGQTREQRLR